jgi:hypothetical protein
MKGCSLSKTIAVYVAGPISRFPAGGSQFDNVREGVLVGERLRAAGLAPLVPHLSALWQMLAPVPYEGWMSLDFAWIERCDALLRMPGDSPGADREVAHAEDIGVPVFYTEADLLKWAARR